MRKVIALIQIFCIVLWNVPLGKADDSDIFGTNVQPNVMILLDSSGSMDDQVASISYSPSTTYTGSNAAAKVYKKNCFFVFCWYTVYTNTVAEVNSASAQTALNSVGYWTGSIAGSSLQLFLGNYLNYSSCSSCQGLQKKLDIAKSVITDLIQNTEGIRFGVMRFNATSNGALMVAPIGTATSVMVTAVNAIVAVGNTPLGEMLRDAGDYFKGNLPGFSSPIQYSCQPSFVIMITDGLQNGSVDVRTEATNRYTQDHSSYTGTQNLIVHSVGFAIAAGESAQATAVMQTAATNGGGTHYTADNAAALQAALSSAIQQIVSATFSFATPVIPTTGASGSNRAYLAAFQSNPSRPFWRGYLKAYNRDANGLIPVDAQGIPSGTPAWDAGQLLSVKSAASRTIYTYASGALQSFIKTNAAITAASLTAADSTERDKIIDFTRGIDSYDEDADGNTTEERAWKLGDIFHSTPVLVSPPFMPSSDSTYISFKTAYASRTTILLAGANDGMLHGFRESDGAELWGFIPPDVLDNLKGLAANSGQHGFTVDGSPIVADVKISGAWKTIAVFGLRRGGKVYYALDITDTTNPQYLWSFTDSRMGESWSEPAIGKVKMSDGTDKYVAFVGGGYDTPQNNNSGKAFFVIDLANGSKLWEYYNSSSSDDRQYMNFSLPASPTAVDLNNDGYIDRVYIGDVGGQLWKFDLSKPAALSGSVVTTCAGVSSTNCWMGKRIFAAASSQTNPPASGEYYPAQAIYGAPALSYDLTGNLWVYFGTGDRNHPNNASTNRFYGIKENTTMTNGSTLTESSLTNVTSGSGTVTQGWYVVLANNEKVLSSADVFNKIVFYTTFTPVTTAACGSGGGNAKLYAVNLTSGDGAINLSTGAKLASGQGALTTAKAIGTGIPSKPMVIIRQSGNTGNPYVISGTTNQQISSASVPQVTSKRLVGWREVF